MFRSTELFNQPIGDWNVSNVTNMEGMLSYAYSFNQPLDKWNVANVTNMKNMFEKSEDFNQPIGCWNVEKVTNLEGMFEGAEAYDLTKLQPKKYEDRTDTEKEEFIKQCREIKPLQQLVTNQYPELNGIFKDNGSIKIEPNGGKRKSKKSKRKTKKTNKN